MTIRLGHTEENSTASLNLESSNQQLSSQWRSPPKEIQDILYAPQLPWAWVAPTGKHMLLADPIFYPALSELAAPMHELAGLRVNPVSNTHHGRHGGLAPRLVIVENGSIIELRAAEPRAAEPRATEPRATEFNVFPADAEVYGVRWTTNGQRFALIVKHSDHVGLWLGSVDGEVSKVEGIELNILLGNPVSWLPDQQRLLLRRIPERGTAPAPPTVPRGPDIREGDGASARSTYEARNLLKTAHDDALFDYYSRSELVLLDPAKNQTQVIGAAAPYATAQFSPSGQYLLVQRLIHPWSHEVTWPRFASQIEVWDSNGEVVASIASLPVADAVPPQGVPLGPRAVAWRPTAPHTLFWVEALDGGDPVAEAPHRDRLMRLAAPFNTEPELVFQAEHRIQPWRNAWTAEGNTLMLTQRERLRRWRYVWLLDVEQGTSRLWFDLNEGDRYADPGFPLFQVLPNGYWVLQQQGDAVYFSGSGATEEGDRPFLDLRDLNTSKTERLFRSHPDRYESFTAFAGDDNSFILRSESPGEVPNYYLASFGAAIPGDPDEATRALRREAITHFVDPTPQLRQIEKRIVRYEREDGVPLSFHLYLPPGYQPGKPLPTVLYAYPLEYSDATTAGQVRGSAQRFMRLYGASHLYFLLQGYAVLDQTAMPMLGDPETVYDTFVPQLIADAEAAVTKAVEMGVADPERIGIIGHSHGGLMVANLLAHTDLFRAGIARSGSYNKTNQPFGYQAERRSLFEARDAYIQASPTFFADQVNEPVLIIHGDSDSNPGTRTFQSQVFYEAVRGSGGTARLVLLPFEDHGYRARESIEHVLWEQLRWFDQYVKGAEPRRSRNIPGKTDQNDP